MGIPASQRLRKPSDFQQVRRSGHRIHCGPFVVQSELVREGGASLPKLGVIASRRVGNAVKRNRGKRLVREIFRRQAPGLPRGSRFVVVLRSGFDHHAFSDMEASFSKAVSQLVENKGPKGRDQ